MSYNSNNDNLYNVGSIITAKANPELKLMIMRYYHRTYYCADVKQPHEQHLCYFEKDLISPSSIRRENKMPTF
jgi:hypothetical protein